MQKSRRCPNCGWRYPIAIVSAPGRRKDNGLFDCPDCDATLVYRAGRGGRIYWFFSALTVPTAILLFLLPEDSWVRWGVFFIALPLALAAAVYCRLEEWIEKAE